MSSNGSRKRRHKSKEKNQTANTNSEESKDSVTASKSTEQPTQQQHQSEQPADEDKHQQQDAEIQLAALMVKQPLTGLWDRLFFSRQTELPSQGPQDLEPSQNSLMIAASSGDVNILKQLWALSGNNLDINTTDKDGNTALHVCTQNSCREGVSFLMSCGADVNAKNNMGQTPLHIAAKQGDQEVCDTFIKSLTTEEPEDGEQQPTIKGILLEDLAGRTPICEALRFQHLVVVKTLMNSCDQEEALDFYVRRIQKLKSLPTGSEKENDLDIQSIMGSLLLVIKRLQKDHLKELAEADPISCLVEVVRLNVESIRVLSTACLMISQLIWKEYPEDEDECIKFKEQSDYAANDDVRDELLKQFLDCRGPHMVMEKLSSHVFTAQDTYLIVSTLLPVMILASRAAGKIWLEQNSGNLSFFKELLTRKKTFIRHINLRNQLGHGLQVGQLIKEFLTFVEGIEAKDREQNLVELLEEEERERIKREKKKRKRQKKHNKQAKAEAPQVAIVEASTDDESAAPTGAWSQEEYRSGPDANPLSVENHQARLLFPQHQDSQQPQKAATTNDHQAVPQKLLRSDSEEKSSEKEPKWARPVAASEEFPPISAGSDDRVTTDTSDGWVKVEGRKPGGRNALKPMTSCLVNPNPVKIQELTKLAPMRWADVAKIGCSKDSGVRNFTVLLGDVGRPGNPDYFKLSNLSKTTEASASVVTPSSNSEVLKGRAEDRTSEWQQIARNAFVDNMSAKERDTERITQPDASSDSDSEDMSSTSSSECPSGLSSELKNSLSVAEDFFGLDSSFSKTICKNREFPSFACAFSNLYSEAREHSLFPGDEMGCFDSHKRSFVSQTALVDSALTSDKNHHRNDEKLHDSGIDWSWLDDKTLGTHSGWNTGSSSRPSDMSSLEACSDRKYPFQRREDRAGAHDLTSMLSSPPYSKRDLLYDLTPGLGTNSSGLHQLQANKDRVDSAKMSFEYPFQKRSFLEQQQSLDAWQSTQLLHTDVDRNQWKDKEARVKPLTRKVGTAWSNLLTIEGSSSAHQQAVDTFMPSFASMSNAVDNNPIVTSVVESVLTPTVNPLSSLCLDSKLPTYCSSANEIPSPPPGFQLQRANPLRAFAFDQTLALLSTQNAFSKSTVLGSETVNQKYGLPSSAGHGDFDVKLPDKAMAYGTPRSRSPMVGVVGPFTKMAKPGNVESFAQQQQARQQRQLLPTSIGTTFGATTSAPSFSSVVMYNSTPRSSATPTVFGLPISASQRISAASVTSSWSERVAQSISHGGASPLINSTASTSSSLLDFSSILSGRPQARMTSRVLDSQSSVLKRASDNQLRSLQEVMECFQRRQAEQSVLQQQLHEIHQQQCYGLSGQQLSHLYRHHKSNLSSLQQQQKKSSVYQAQQRQQQFRFLQPQASPPVLFPSDLRDEAEPRGGDKQQSFPAFHEAIANDLLSDLFADPLLIERIAINQIRQQFLTQQANCLLRDSAMSALRDSVYGNDLEYYASMYRVKLKDILGGSQWHPESAGNRCDQERQNLTTARSSGGQDGRCLSPVRDSMQEKSSRRWRDAISRILETPWTMRRQYGDIVLPSALAEYTVSHVEFPLVLGLNTDGQEIAVLVLDKSQAYIDPCLLDVMCDPELGHHFILKCKGMSETCTAEYVALELCDYTLSEYMQIVQLSHRQDALSANRLSWQLLEGLKFVHLHLGMPHGFLKPSWIFVDSEGRLRLGGCGIVTKQSAHIMGSSAIDRSESARSACWTSSEDLNNDHLQPSMASDIQVAGMLLYFILTGGQHPFGASPLEVELNIARNSSQMQHISEEANDLVSGMLFPDPSTRPTIEHCLKHPFFWSSEKKFRLILIVGSDVLTEMKTGIALTGNGSPTMMEILGVLDISEVSPNWVQAINPTVMKEMRSFRVYKNSLSELTLFIYNCCLHFDKMSAVAKEVLDDPCKYFQSLFPSLFMAIYRSLKASDRIDRTCYKPFF